jgi:ATP diphosphatase
MTDSPNTKAAEALVEFLKVMEELRDPQGGCPWDLKQTFESLRSHLVEEAYEIGDAVEESPKKVCEELGDLLSLIGLYCQIARESSLFSFADIVHGITEKLVRRHPHVFGDTKVSGTKEVLENWEAIKLQEKAEAGAQKKGLLDGLPRSMPALMRAHEIGERCARVGFDWDSAEGVAEKVREELTEFLEEAAPQAGGRANQSSERIVEEFGDLLFTLAQQSRLLGFNAEEALAAANAKFSKRFKALETFAFEQHSDIPLGRLSAEQLQALWLQAKKTLP